MAPLVTRESPCVLCSCSIYSKSLTLPSKMATVQYFSACHPLESSQQHLSPGWPQCPPPCSPCDILAPQHQHRLSQSQKQGLYGDPPVLYDIEHSTSLPLAILIHPLCPLLPPEHLVHPTPGPLCLQSKNKPRLPSCLPLGPSSNAPLLVRSSPTTALKKQYLQGPYPTVLLLAHGRHAPI